MAARTPVLGCKDAILPRPFQIYFPRPNRYTSTPDQVLLPETKSLFTNVKSLFRKLKSLFRPPKCPFLIPLDIALRLAALLVLQVLQDAGIGADGEVVVLPTSEGSHAGRHAEAVQVASDVEGGLRDFLRVEVVTRIEVDGPLVGNLDVPVDVQRIQAELVGIAHPLAVDGLGAVFGDVEARAEVDGPSG